MASSSISCGTFFFFRGSGVGTDDGAAVVGARVGPAVVGAAVVGDRVGTAVVGTAVVGDRVGAGDVVGGGDGGARAADGGDVEFWTVPSCVGCCVGC